MLQKLFSFCFDQLFPPCCLVCHTSGADLCRECSRGIQPSPKTLSIERLSVQTCFDYHQANHPQLMEAWKYRGSGSVFTALQESLCEFDIDADWIIPVPAHPRRKAERGFNQSEIIASYMSKQLGIPVHSLLKRIRYTEKQARLSAEKRADNLLGAFAVVGRIPNGKGLIVDDVVTTGATLLACAKTLKEGGAERVSGFCLMRAEKFFNKKNSANGRVSR